MSLVDVFLTWKVFLMKRGTEKGEPEGKRDTEGERNRDRNRDKHTDRDRLMTLKP